MVNLMVVLLCSTRSTERSIKLPPLVWQFMPIIETKDETPPVVLKLLIVEVDTKLFEDETLELLVKVVEDARSCILSAA